VLTGVYYNECDPFAADWLEELIKEGAIARGEVDRRKIEEVTAADVRGFAQCHFFAGIGGWSAALRLAGWPDDRPVWTGSCPCQPFSAAGAQVGGNDPRHLWPTWFRLIRESRPAVVFGEQVAAAINHGWIDLVFDDLEREGYACGAVDLPACGVGAFHIRQRVWFVADSGAIADGVADTFDNRTGRPTAAESRGDGAHDGIPGAHGGISGRVADDDKGGRQELGASRLHDYGASGHDVDGLGEPGWLSDADGRRREQRDAGERRVSIAGANEPVSQLGDGAIGGLGVDGGASRHAGHVDESSAVNGLGHGVGAGLEGHAGHVDNGDESGRLGAGAAGSITTAGGVGFWAEVEWIPCRDGKARPVKPGIFPLAYGVSNRVGTLRGAGNAIVPQAAAEIILAYRAIRG
jgi:DNA (cytosine-5)-methyltransferase 1